ncbi:MAG: hypothetical protein IT168_09870 [Bryobacterales bacterium]|nr:hypothetical protein [Bryobacterales bacterium]
MSVYTCYDMVADCQAAKHEGWMFFAQRMVPALRLLARHYKLGEEAVRRFVTAPEVFRNATPMPEREFLTQQREALLAAGGYQGGKAGTLDLKTVAEAFSELTTVERQIAWLETLEYSTAEAAWLLRASEQTAVNARRKAGDALRAKLDSWTANILWENGSALGGEARAAAPAEATTLRVCYDLIDGRLTWRDRAEFEHRLQNSWWEIDQLCRAREADEALRASKNLTEDEAYEFLSSLKLPSKKPKKSWLSMLARS